MGFDVCMGDDICDMSDMILNWSRKAVKMFGEVTARLTKPVIDAKKEQLNEAFKNQVFRGVGAPNTSP